MATATNDTPTLETIGVELKGASEILVATHDVLPPACFVDGERVATFPELAEAEAFADDLRKIAKSKRVVAGVRALADFLDAHPELDISWVTAHVERPNLMATKAEVREDLGATVQVLREHEGFRNAGISHGNLAIGVEFADSREYEPLRDRADVSLEARFDHQKVCDPEVVDGEVVWNLPDGLGAVGDES